MKIFLILIILSTFCISQEKEKETSPVELTPEQINKIKEDAKVLGRDYVLIAKYIENEYINKPKKKLEKLREDFDKLNSKLQIAKTESQKKAIIEKMKKIKAEFEVFELWKKYHKVYIVQNQAYIAKDNSKYREARKYLGLIESEYTKVTALTFPRFKSDFYSKYKDKLEALRKDYIRDLGKN